MSATQSRSGVAHAAIVRSPLLSIDVVAARLRAPGILSLISQSSLGRDMARDLLYVPASKRF